MKISFEADFDDNSEEIKKAAEEQIEVALTILGSKAQDYAIGLCPVDTGRLRNSITYVTSNSQGAANTAGLEPAKDEDFAPHGTPAKGDVYIGTNVEYAPNQEFGDSGGTAANGGIGFLRPAVERHLGEFKSILQEELST